MTTLRTKVFSSCFSLSIVLGKLLRGGRFSARPANPSFARLRYALNIRERGVGEKFAMFVGTQECHAGQWKVLLSQLGNSGVRSSIYFRDDNKHPTWLQHS